MDHAAGPATSQGAARRQWPGSSPASAAVARVPLTGADFYDWVALRRVSGGGIAKAGCFWFDRGHRVPCYVEEALGALRTAGLVVLADPDSTDLAPAVPGPDPHCHTPRPPSDRRRSTLLASSARHRPAQP